MRVEISGGGDALPVSDGQIETHFETLGLSDVSEVTGYLQSAVAQIESYAGIAMIEKVATVTFDAWPNTMHRDDWHDGVRQLPASHYQEFKRLQLPIGPHRADQTFSVFTIDEDGDETQIPSDQFYIETGRFPVLRCKKSGSAASSIKGMRFKVVYGVGYGASDAAVPADLRNAVLDQALREYERRGDEDLNAGFSAHTMRIMKRYKRVRL